MKSDAQTVEQVLSSLPEKQHHHIEIIRQVILDHLPDGYEETMNSGMITFQVPLTIFHDTYNKKPLMYAGLTVQKNHIALYLMPIYMSEKLRKDFENELKTAGSSANMAKSCIRFKNAKDLPLQFIGKTVASYKVDDFIALYKKSRSGKKRKS